jgi:colanic acid biosynthesis glycosyl transferase WcaI
VTRRPIVVLCPHFTPDTAPTGEIMARIVEEFVAAGERVHVVTSLPWYRAHAIEEGWGGRLVRRERTPWGSVIRVHPFPGGDKTNLPRRAAGFLFFTLVAGVCTLAAGGWRRRPAAVLSMSPPLTTGLTGWLAARLRGAPAVFDIQDVFPDAAVETGAITNRTVIALARRLERASYRCSDAVVVLSDDLADNVRTTIGADRADRVHVIPNFVDAERIVPRDRDTAYRAGLGIGGETVVMYAGNVGFSQSLGMLLEAARALPDTVFVINGEGAARRDLEREAAGLANVRFSDYQPRERVPEVLASADIHVVPLRSGLGRVSVPSKTYSILAAGRPVVACIDPGTEVPRILAASGGGVALPPDDPTALIGALTALTADPVARREMGEKGRAWVESHVSPRAVARSWLDLFTLLER